MEKKDETGISRREFLEKLGKYGGALLVSGAAGSLFAGEWEHGNVNFWRENFFHQDAVDSSREAEGIIRALMEGSWNEFNTIQLPQAFLDWNLTERLRMLDNIMGMMMGDSEASISLAGPHNAAMATTGGGRLDSRFEVNNAFKGMGLCPRRDLIKGYIEHYNETNDAPMPEKINFLKELYSNADNFDLTKMISLELYSTPDFETHTFLNLMAHPSVSLVFLDRKSYEVRGIGELVHPADEEVVEYERDIVTYTNLAHSYFHGDFPRIFPGILVHVTEVFDNSPGTGRGVRMAPPF